jgi:hypothetical protein
MMRFVGVGLLVLGLLLSGASIASARSSHSGPPLKPCDFKGVSYPVGSYCYTSCAPSAACEVLVCFTGDVTSGVWAHIGACKVRDCSKTC